MLLDMLDIPTAYAVIGSVTALGVGVKLLLGSIYKRDIRNVRSIEHTKKRWIKRMRRNFEKTFGDGLSRDAELFVENELNGRQVCGISVKNLDGFINQLPLVILTATSAFDFWFVNRGNPLNDLVPFTMYGATMCLAIHTFNMLVNNQSKENRLKILLTQYFGNEKLPLILMNQYSDEKLLEKKENYTPNALACTAAAAEGEGRTENLSPRGRRKRLKAEKLRLKRLLKQQKKEERLKRQETRKLMRQQALKAEYEEKMKKLQEKYRLEPEEASEPDSFNMAFAASGAELGEEVKRVMQDRKVSEPEDNVKASARLREKEAKKDVLNQTLNEAFPENKSGKDDEKLIEEVLKEYLFK